jgi:hypothetical protein
MTEPQDPVAVAWWAAKLDDLDHEIISWRSCVR